MGWARVSIEKSILSPQALQIECKALKSMKALKALKAFVEGGFLEDGLLSAEANKSKTFGRRRFDSNLNIYFVETRKAFDFFFESAKCYQHEIVRFVFSPNLCLAHPSVEGSFNLLQQPTKNIPTSLHQLFFLYLEVWSHLKAFTFCVPFRASKANKLLPRSKNKKSQTRVDIILIWPQCHKESCLLVMWAV